MTAVAASITIYDTYSLEEFERLVSRETDRVELKTGVGGKPFRRHLSPSATATVE